MSKLTREDKIEIYEQRKNGESIRVLSEFYGVRRDTVRYLVRLLDAHGPQILRSNKNRYYPPEFKEEIIDRTLFQNESIISIAIEIGLSSDGMIHNWIREYKKNGYNVIEKKRGRSSMTKPINEKTERTVEEELETLKKKNQRLEAENEYLKKLNAVVKQRVEREKKKKPE